MDEQTQEAVRARAYMIWEREGRPAGREQEHWEQALRELGLSGDGERPADSGDPVAASGNGLASGLQPGGSVPGGSPAVGEGSIGTGGGSTRRAATGTRRRAKT